LPASAVTRANAAFYRSCIELTGDLVNHLSAVFTAGDVAFTNGDLLIEGMVKQDAEIATALWTTPKVSALTRFEARLRGWLTSDDIRRDNSRAADVVRPLRSFIKKVPLQKNVIDNNDRC
jgi:hypothetical protein